MAHVRITTDASGALEALDAAVRLRAAGDSFDLALRLDDDRGSIAAVLAADVCRAEPEPGSRRSALEKIGSPDATIGLNPLIRFATMDLAAKATVRDLATLARSLVFRSWAEMRRAVMNFDIVHQSYVIETARDERVPEPVSRERPDGSVVIWAPDEPVERLYLVLTAAAETGRAVRVVCKGGDLANIPVEIVPIEDARGALARASVCIAASLSDPAPAIALSRWGIPLCATFTSGAYEQIDSVASYRSWSVSSAAAAIAYALGAPPPRFAPPPAVYPGRIETPTRDALVTLIVRDGGDAISGATADSIARQSHTNCELIAAPDARAVREALHAARGTYVAFLRNGDILFREGIAVLVNALENARADVAYGDGAFGYLADAPGPPAVFGYSVLERMPIDERTMAASDEFVGAYFRVLFRREPLVRIGLRDDLDDLAIYDAFLRTLRETTAIHVDDVCGMSYRYLDGRVPGEAAVTHAIEYEKIYARIAAEDSAMQAARAAVLHHLRSHARVGLRPPPQRLNPPRPAFAAE
jgi:hypothetical protein